MNDFAHGKFHGKRVVVFGCGYVGSAFARQTAVAGALVTALTRNETKARMLREAGIAVVVSDLATRDWHSRIPRDAEFILNCVGSGRGGIEQYHRSYVGGMESVAEWAQRGSAPQRTFVYTSSTSVYPQDGGATVDENAPTGGDERAQVLLAAEHRLAAVADAGTRWFVLRLAGIYGPDRSHLLAQVRAGEVAGRPETRLNFAHRDDIVTAIVACFIARSEVRNEVFNVADDQPAPRDEVARWLAAQLQLPAPRITGEPAGGRRALTPDRIISNAKAKAVLGWRPRFPSYRAGFERLLSR